jgi:uncharacterized membrane protein YdjX (TVP38/TMEM64 family)
MQTGTAHVTAPAPTPSIRRWLPLLGLLGVMVLGYGLGLQRYFSFQSVVEHEALLNAIVEQHLLASVAIYFLVYVAVVALSLPGAAVLSILGGFIFGWALSGTVTIFAATLGAVAVFKIVQTSLGAAIAERAGPFVQKLSRGFEKDAFNYLLFLRLVPAFPFFAINAVAGLTKMKLRTFALGTLIGIIPGSYAFAWLGRGLGSVIDAARMAQEKCVALSGAENCHTDFVISSLVTPQLLLGFAALGVVSLIPVLLKKWKTFS